MYSGRDDANLAPVGQHQRQACGPVSDVQHVFSLVTHSSRSSTLARCGHPDLPLEPAEAGV